MSKPGYRFKLLFRIRQSTFVDEAPGSVTLTREGDTAEIKLHVQSLYAQSDSQAEATARLDDMRSFAIIGEPYESVAAARNAAADAKKAVLIWCARENRGVDFHWGQASDPNIEPVDSASLNIYLELYPKAASSLQTFSKSLSSSFRSDRCDPKHVLALEIFSTSHFDRSPMSRVVMQVTAIETLMEQDRSSARLIDWIQKLKKLSLESALESEDLDQILNALGRQKKESKTRAGIRLADKLLPNRTYKGMTAGEVFKYLYSIRSTIVHEGDHKMGSKEFESVSELCGSFVRDMLLASVAPSG